MRVFLNVITFIFISTSLLACSSFFSDPWLQTGISPAEVRSFKKEGFSPTEAQFWKNEGFSATEAQSWKNEGFSLSEAKSLKDSGFSASDGHWEDSGFSLSEAKSWKNAGFSLSEALSWNDGFSLSEAKSWKHAGFSASEAQSWKTDGITPSEAKHFKYKCPKGIDSNPFTLVGNPYQLKGYCMNLKIGFVGIFQMISRNSALVKVFNPNWLAFLNTGKGTIKTNGMGLLSLGWVRFEGVYKYTNVMGALQIIPYIVPIK